MDARQTVVFSVLLSVLTFWLAGDEATRKTTNGLNRLRGASPVAATSDASGPNMTVTRAAGWGAIFVMLIIASDAVPELGASFAVLLLISTLLAFGPDAFANIEKVLNAGAASDTNGRARGGTF